MKEEIVIVCVGLRWDAGRACQVVAKIAKCSRHGTHWSALSLNSCALFAHILRTVHAVARQFRHDASWHLGKNFQHFKILATTWHALFHLTRIPTHLHAHCHEFCPHWHAKLSAMARTVCRKSVRLASRVAYASP